MGQSAIISNRKIIPFRSQGQRPKELLREVEELRSKVKALEEAEAKRLETEKALQGRLALEKILASISTRFLNVSLEEIDREVEWALRNIGEFRGVGQSFFCLLSPDGKGIERAYCWSRKVDSGKVRILHGLSLESFVWPMEKLRNFETVFIPDAGGRSFEAMPEKATFADPEIRALLAVPLSFNGQLMGIMGLSLLERDKPWPEEEISLLKVIGEILLSAFIRKRMELARRESEERYHIISKISIDGASSIRFERDGTFRREWITESLSRIFGIDPGEFNSYGSYASFIHPEDLPIFTKAVSSLSQQREPITVELRALTRSGEIRWLRAIAHPEWDEKEGRLVRVINVVQDITERKRAEEGLRASEERYRILVKNAPVGILSTNREGEITEVNPVFLRIFGLPGEEAAKGLNLFTFPPFAQAGIAPDFKRAMEKGEPSIHIRTYKGPMGKEMHLRYYLAPLRDGAGRMTGLQAIVEDITESKRLEDQLLQAQKMEAIGTLAGGIAHDFNNILAGIIGYAELMGFEIVEGSSAQAYLAELLKAAQRAKDLVKQILAFSRRSDQGKEMMAFEPVLQESIRLLRASLPSTIQIHLEIEKDLGPIYANPTQIQQVVMNLGTNAAQALPEGNGIIKFRLDRVEFDPEAAWKIPGLPPGSYIRLSVSDTGQGMPPEVIRRIFDPYFTTKERGKGTGLGLAVVHGIVKNHDGAITVESELGRGTTFEVYLPRAKGAEKMDKSRKDQEGPCLGRERILYVDDEQLVAQVGKQMLEKLGYEVVPMMDSQEALELFRAQPDRFDLVVTDMTMPNLTGDKLALELMAIRPNIPIVLCTGYSERITEMKAKELGIREYVCKPFAMNDLARAVHRALAASGPWTGPGAN